ncbi:MAG: DUF1638 domain-containing protein [Synergistaceae bacterium]|nr:DUF1638 domain-containing protein [Synergistaceae bacterium]
MRLKLLACKVFFREISLIASVCENYLDVTYIRQGLHDTPNLLKESLQREIDGIDSGSDLHSSKFEYSNKDFDAILLGYGLCGNGVVGLSSKKYTLVVPRAHDCVTLFLGSRQAYKDYFEKHNGTFWYNVSLIENSSGLPSEETDIENLKIYTEHFGEEDARYILENCRPVNYNRCTYVKWDELNFPKYEQCTKDAAAYLGWDFDIVLGNSGLLRDFMNGDWDEENFLVVPPGKKIEANYQDMELIVKTED